MINNIPQRQTRSITIRPITESGKNKFGVWIGSQTWNQIKETFSLNEKVTIFHNTLTDKVRDFFPQKTLKVTSDDSPGSINK